MKRLKINNIWFILSRFLVYSNTGFSCWSLIGGSVDHVPVEVYRNQYQHANVGQPLFSRIQLAQDPCSCVACRGSIKRRQCVGPPWLLLSPYRRASRRLEALSKSHACPFGLTVRKSNALNRLWGLFGIHVILANVLRTIHIKDILPVMVTTMWGLQTNPGQS